MKRNIVFFLIFFLFCAKDSFALRCKRSLVDTGDSKGTVLIKCGKPLLTEHWTIENSKKIFTGDVKDGKKHPKQEKLREKKTKKKRNGKHLYLGYIDLLNVDLWTYNFGPQNFTYELMFKNNLLVRITPGNYGYQQLLTTESGDGKPKSCTYTVISKGTKKIDLLAGCGAPTFKEVRDEVQVNTKHSNSGDMLWKEKITNLLETWTYNFGPQNFIYHIELVNGTISSYTTGEYGSPKE